METTPLRDLIEARLGDRWEVWARRHPHLAAAIDRTRLVEASVDRLREDPEFQRAMLAADIDEAKLAAAAGLLSRVEEVLGRALFL